MLLGQRGKIQNLRKIFYPVVVHCIVFSLFNISAPTLANAEYLASKAYDRQNAFFAPYERLAQNQNAPILAQCQTMQKATCKHNYELCKSGEKVNNISRNVAGLPPKSENCYEGFLVCQAACGG